MTTPAKCLLLMGAVLLPGVAAPRVRTWIERATADRRSIHLTNPYAGQKDAAKAGEKLYQRYCSSCHGADAAGIDRSPSLHSPTVKSAAPGALYWLMRNGSLKRGMPSWSSLPPEQRWQLVTWLKSLE